jgi:hypothetical protein
VATHPCIVRAPIVTPGVFGDDLRLLGHDRVGGQHPRIGERRRVDACQVGICEKGGTECEPDRKKNGWKPTSLHDWATRGTLFPSRAMNRICACDCLAAWQSDV